jgi:hypothetical protein
MMRHLLVLSSLVLLAACAAPEDPPAEEQAPPAEEQQPDGRERIDVSRLGPQVGEAVPDFALLDQDGNEQTVESLMGPNGLMLVFIRSADW